MALHLQVGPNVIESYQRLSYSPWHALAEYVDNSTQNYENNKERLREVYERESSKLDVSIVYDRQGDNGKPMLRIADNAMGMTYQQLEDALCLGKRPTNTSGRSQYGLGLKTASCWFGDKWRIRTKHIDEEVEHVALVSVPAVALGKEIEYSPNSNVERNAHYTVIELNDLHQTLHGRTLRTIKDYLRSIYRMDLMSGLLTLRWNNDQLTWDNLESELLRNEADEVFRKEFVFELSTGEEIIGWVGIFAKGGRAKAGFSILHRKRVIKGWPFSYRPSSIYGQLEGSNNLINQRIVGEIHMDDFDVSHTKDDILWRGDQISEVERKLYDECKNYMDIATKHRVRDQRKPSELQTKVALEKLEEEILSSFMVDSIQLEDVPPQDVISQSLEQLDEIAEKTEPTFSHKVGNICIAVYLSNDLSSNDPYVRVNSVDIDDAVVIINMNHPYLSQISGSDGLLNFFRECTFDGIAEHKARHRAGRTDPDTIKVLKDHLFRIPFKMDAASSNNANDAEADKE